MPTVPVLEGPRVATRAMPTPYSNLDARGTFGEAGAVMAKGIASGAEGVASALEQARERADRAAVLQGEAALGEYLNGKLYDKERGLLNLQGIDAVNRSKADWDEAQKKHREIASKLSNDRQRAMFEERTVNALQGTYKQIETHTAGEIRRVEGDAFKAWSKTAEDALAAGWGNEEARRTSLAEAERRLGEEADRLGMTPEAAAAFRQEWRQNAADRALAANMAGLGAAQARALFDSAREDLSPTKRGAYEKAVVALERGEAVEKKATEILAGAVNEKTGLLDAEAARAALAKSDAPDKKDIAAAIERGIQKADDTHKRRIEGAVKAIVSVYEQNGHNLGDPRIAPLKAFLLEPHNDPEAWAKIERSDYSRRTEGRRLNAEERRNAAEARREQERIDALALERLRGMPTKDATEADLKGKFPGVSELGMARLVTEQKRAKGHWDKDKGVTDADFKANVAATAARLKYGKAKGAMFTRAMLDRRAKWEAANPGKVPDEGDVATMFAEAVGEVQVKGTLYGTNEMPAWLAEQQGKKPLPKPEAVDSALREQLSAEDDGGDIDLAPLTPPKRSEKAAPATKTIGNKTFEKRADGRWYEVK